MLDAAKALRKLDVSWEYMLHSDDTLLCHAGMMWCFMMTS